MFHGNNLCANLCVNINIDHFEMKTFNTFRKGLSLIFLRFVDEIFFIWAGSKNLLIKLLNQSKLLNIKHGSFKFEYPISKSNTSFPDTDVYVKGNKLSTKIHKRKQTGDAFFISIQSIQKSLNESTPYNQTLRIKHICSTAKISVIAASWHGDLCNKIAMQNYLIDI